jgi:anti-anti-sigma factor
MNPSGANMSVWVGEQAVCIKIAGRANFAISVDFKTLVTRLAQQGHRRFVLELSDCVLMDSTFLGVLARLGMNFALPQNGSPAGKIELLNANARVTDLLDNLGVAHLFATVTGTCENVASLAPVASGGDPDRKDFARTSLEAHQTLMELNPANVAKFKDVARFLAEDLKRMEEEKSRA